MTLRAKLNSLFGFTLIIGFSVMTAVALQQSRNQRRVEIVEGVEQTLNEINHKLDYLERDPNGLESQLYDAIFEVISHQAHTTVATCAYNYEGSKDVTELSVFPGHKPKDLDYHEFMASELTISRARTIHLHQGIRVKVTVFTDASKAIEFQRRLLRIFLLVAGVVMVACLVTTSILTEQLVTSPIDELRRLTRRVAKGDLEAAPPWTLRNRYDEIGVLSTSFATMLAVLRRAREENEALLDKMQEFNRQLESRITDATAQLEERNREIHAANEALLGAREQITRQERFAALGQLAGSIAHEIGTPLSTISGHLQLLLFDETLDSESKECVEIAHGEATRMAEIIRRFLTSTKGVQPILESFDLRALLTHAIKLSVPASEASQFEVQTYLDPSIHTLYSDPALLRQLLINLISNARDAMPDGGTVVLEAVKDKDHLVLHIDDTGPGVPEDLKRRIFEPFFTTKGPDRGTGLGLAICQEIARALKGKLSVAQAPEGGARFTLRLPAWQDGMDSSHRISS